MKIHILAALVALIGVASAGYTEVCLHGTDTPIDEAPGYLNIAYDGRYLYVIEEKGIAAFGCMIISQAPIIPYHVSVFGPATDETPGKTTRLIDRLEISQDTDGKIKVSKVTTL
jgi:hypothetical protein